MEQVSANAIFAAIKAHDESTSAFGASTSQHRAVFERCQMPDCQKAASAIRRAFPTLQQGGAVMETPKNEAGRLTERIMSEIREHLKEEPPPQENHHYNRVYERIYWVLKNEAKVKL